ncbi:hypothetical protein PAAG_05087 [Paracoccidioides lutzii Pb01]|uniref:RRM domain-containing protein n=1 Tax=Paracoccidioides lutzii (strain ATCC MYA-826 / Pb01) TaxID=502779 RepID=C1H2U4_PARBA|nr:hypothetical protein PAAG_05087 [Paracoccidioides lutzii Pb01]EEH34038.2 hypothetical protein PAAG_05087 [Paracoccidioides lutzii Pb01]
MANYLQRERSRSPRRRSRSPRRGRRSYSPRSRSRSRDDYRRNDRRSRSPVSGAAGAPGGHSASGYGGRNPSTRSYEDRSFAKEQMMQAVRESSQQDRRVYVGNLSYDVKWHHLKDFMRQAGEVLFADVLLLPNGMSKVGVNVIVEYATREQAQNAVATLSNQNLMGRLVYVREDREAEPRFTGAPARGDFGGPGRGGYGGGYGSGSGAGGSRQIYVSNLPFSVGWQDLKDLFRQAAQQGAVVRADVHVDPSGRPKGSGIVAFESADDARNAIQQFNGYDWQGRTLEVREDLLRDWAQALVVVAEVVLGAVSADAGADLEEAMVVARGGGAGDGSASVPPNPFTDFATSGGERSAIIFVRNLPWSTCNEDLVDLFSTIGKVERAEIQYEPNGRSRGTGVVEFDSVENAETAISKLYLAHHSISLLISL